MSSPNTILRDFYAKCRAMAASGAVLYRQGRVHYLYDGVYGDWLDFVVVGAMINNHEPRTISDYIRDDDRQPRFSVIIEGISGGNGRRSNQVRRVLNRIFRASKRVRDRDHLPGKRCYDPKLI